MRKEQIKRSFAILLFVLTSLTWLRAQEDKSQRPSPPGQTSVSFGDGKKITIDYSRPSARGRKVFGDLVPYGEEWRAGANEATTFVTTADLTVGDLRLPKGSYTLFTLPNKDNWMLIVSKQTGEWGLPYPGKEFDFGRTAMKVGKTPAPVEQFVISFDKTNATKVVLKLAWENTQASVEITERQ